MTTHPGPGLSQRPRQWTNTGKTRMIALPYGEKTVMIC